MESLLQLFQMQAQILIAHAHDEETSRKRSSSTTFNLASRKRSKNERSPATVQLAPCQQSVTEHSQQPGPPPPRTLCQFCQRNQPGHWCANWACRRCCSQGEYACEQHGTRSPVEELRSASGMSMEDVDRRLEEMIEAAMRDAGMEAAGIEEPDPA